MSTITPKQADSQPATSAPQTDDAAALRARICRHAIEVFGRDGFDASLDAVAAAAGVSPDEPARLFGSKEQLRQACDDSIADTVQAAKLDALRNTDPAGWTAQMADLSGWAPLMAYVLRAISAGDPAGRRLFDHLLENATRYLDEGVRAGTLKPSRDPVSRARYLALSAAGGCVLYARMHDNPQDMESVLRDYSADMLAPALEIYADGLLTPDLAAALREYRPGAGTADDQH